MLVLFKPAIFPSSLKISDHLREYFHPLYTDIPILQMFPFGNGSGFRPPTPYKGAGPVYLWNGQQQPNFAHAGGNIFGQPHHQQQTGFAYAGGTFGTFGQQQQTGVGSGSLGNYHSGNIAQPGGSIGLQYGGNITQVGCGGGHLVSEFGGQTTGQFGPQQFAGPNNQFVTPQLNGIGVVGLPPNHGPIIGGYPTSSANTEV